jgi:hypothetical protein
MIPKKITIAFLLAGLLLALCLLALTPTCVEAGGGIGREQVRAAVQTWVRYVTADARPGAVVVRMESYQMDGETVAYIAHLAGGGFCLCGADDLVLPVYFYSPRGTYDPENPNYQYILWEIGTRLEYLQKGLEERDPRVLQYRDALSERATFWQDLIAGRIPRRVRRPEAPLAEPISMTLSLTSRWDQNPPYNDQCPEHMPAGQHTIVGCVATAMAQIMYYWKWPNAGVDSASVDYNYRWETTRITEPLATDPQIPPDPKWASRLDWAPPSGPLQMSGDWDGSVYASAQAITDTVAYRNALETLWNRLNSVITTHPADFGAATYDWSIMSDTHPAATGDAEVAKLCHHAGVAVEMDYGIWGSGADPTEVQSALEDHFRYDADTTYGAVNTDTMATEIQWLRPFHFRGENAAGGGHSWLVFGYDKTNDPARQFKMNMGWGGAPGWYSCDSVPNGYTIGQAHTTWIAPEDVVKFVGADSGDFDGSPSDPYKNIREAIKPPLEGGAPDGATLIFKAGSVNTFSGSSLVITRPCTLKGYNVVIRKE